MKKIISVSNVALVLFAAASAKADILVNPDFDITAGSHATSVGEAKAPDADGEIMSLGFVSKSAFSTLAPFTVASQGVRAVGKRTSIPSTVSAGTDGAMNGISYVFVSNLVCADGYWPTINTSAASGVSVGSNQFVKILPGNGWTAGMVLPANTYPYYSGITNTAVQADEMPNSSGNTYTYQAALVKWDGGDGTISATSAPISCTVP